MAASFAKSFGFREYLASRENSIIFQATNVQAWTVLGDRSIWFREGFPQVSDQERCEISLQRLAAYDFVGFTEHLDQLWERVSEHFGWSVAPLPRLCTNAPYFQDEEVSPEDIAFHTALDTEFVRRARLLRMRKAKADA